MKFKVSIIERNGDSEIRKEIEVTSLEQFKEIVETKRWSPFLLAEEELSDKIKITKFKSAAVLVLNVSYNHNDVEENKNNLANSLKHMGLLCVLGEKPIDATIDYRIIAMLEEPINNKRDYFATLTKFERPLGNIFNQFKGLKCYIEKTTLENTIFAPRDKVQIVNGDIIIKAINYKSLSDAEKHEPMRGPLSENTKNFKKYGSSSANAKDDLMKSALDYYDNCYSLEKAVEHLKDIVFISGEKTMGIISNVYEGKLPLATGIVINKTNKPFSTDDLKKKMLTNMDEDIKEAEEGIPILGEELDERIAVKIQKGKLYSVVGRKGSAKTTLASVIATNFLGESGKKVLVIHTEESAHNFYTRVACNFLEISWEDYKCNKVSSDDRDKIKALVEKLCEKLIVKGIDDETHSVTHHEDVIDILNNAAGLGVDLVLIDHIQAIRLSKTHDETFMISKSIADYLNEFRGRVKIPVIAFSQASDNYSGDVFSKVQNDKTFLTNFDVVISIATKHSEQLTLFKIEADRVKSSNIGKTIQLYRTNAGYSLCEPELYPLEKSK